MSNVLTRSKTTPKGAVNTKLPRGILTKEVFKAMIDIIKEDFIIRRFREEESSQGEDKDIYDIDKRIDTYKKEKASKPDAKKITLEDITAKEGEYYLKKRSLHYNRIQGYIQRKKITLQDINNKESKYYLDEKNQNYYYNLWITIVHNPNTPKHKNTKEGDQFISGKITLLGKTTIPAPVATVSSGSLLPNSPKYKGGNLLGTTPRPQNLLHTIHYAHPTWSNFTKARSDLNIYSMQLPYQFNRMILLQTFIELMYVHEVKILLNLHGCDTHSNHGDEFHSVNGLGCNINDMNAEGELWNIAKNITLPTRNDNNIIYISAGIPDFQPGLITTWESIFKGVGDTRLPQNRVTVHCLAGLGRTGSVVLALLMRDFIPVQLLQGRMTVSHLGYANIQSLITELKNLFYNNSNSKKIFNELFALDVPKYLKILRPRLNCIFYCLAQYHNIKQFAMYSKVHNPSNDIALEFSSAVVGNIDWDIYGTNDISATDNARFFTL